MDRSDPGIVLLGGLGVSHAAGGALCDGIGERTHAPDAVGAVADSYTLEIGDLNVDLSAVDFTERREVRVELGIGSAEVIVPRGIDVYVDGDVRFGELRALDQIEDGVDTEVHIVASSGSEHVRPGGAEARAGADLVIILDVGMGEVVVTRSGS